MSPGCCHYPSRDPSSVRNWKQTGFSKEWLCGNTATRCCDLVFIQDPKSSHSYPHALNLLSWRCHENNLPHDFLLFHAFSLDGKLLWEQPLLVSSGTCLVFVAALCCVWHRCHAQGPVMGTVEKTGLKWFWMLNDAFQADGARLCHCSVALCVLHFTAWGHQPSFALILILLLFLWGCVFQAITIHIFQFWCKTSNTWLVSAKRHFTAVLAEIAENRYRRNVNSAACSCPSSAQRGHCNYIYYQSTQCTVDWSSPNKRKRFIEKRLVFISWADKPGLFQLCRAALLWVTVTHRLLEDVSCLTRYR